MRREHRERRRPAQPRDGASGSRTRPAARAPASTATVSPISRMRNPVSAFSASLRTRLMSSEAPSARPWATLRSTVCRSTRSRSGARIASKRAPQSTSGTYTSSAPRCPGSIDIRISPDRQLGVVVIADQREVAAGAGADQDEREREQAPQAQEGAGFELEPAPDPPRWSLSALLSLQKARSCHGISVGANARTSRASSVREGVPVVVAA